MVRGIKLLFLFIFCAFIGGGVCASFAVEVINPLSPYGQIQNVQNYSSNPFWNPNGGYRQNMPVPVYVTGPDVSSGDCERTVSALIASICANNNNCHNMQLGDIRPALMLQLSRLPGHNWATSCAGFMDTAFDNYIRSAEHTVVPTSFPGATTPNPTADGIEYQIPNPFVPDIPDWLREMKGRELELKQLQAMNGAGQESLARAEFPTTYEDIPLSERWASETDGYKPYDGKSPYVPLKLKDAEVRKIASVAKPQGVTQNKDKNKTNDDGKSAKGDDKSSPVPKKENDEVIPESDKEWAVLASAPDMFGGSGYNANNMALLNGGQFMYNPEIPVISLQFNNGDDDNGRAHVGVTALDRCLGRIWGYVSNLDGFTEKTCCTIEMVEDFPICSKSNNKEVDAPGHVMEILKTDSDCLASKAELVKKRWFNAIPYSNARYASVFVMDIPFFTDIQNISLTVQVLPCYDTVINLDHIGENK